MSKTIQINPETLDIEKLARENLSPLRGYIASLGAHPGLVDDLAQDVFIEVMKHIDRYDQSRPFRGWLFGIARNLLHQEFRKNAMDARIRQGLTTEAVIEQEVLEQEQMRLLTKKETLSALQTCMEKLPSKLKKLIELRFKAREKTEKIAWRLKMNGSAVRMALMRTRQDLRQCVESQLRGTTI